MRDHNGNVVNQVKTADRRGLAFEHVLKGDPERAAQVLAFCQQRGNAAGTPCEQRLAEYVIYANQDNGEVPAHDGGCYGCYTYAHTCEACFNRGMGGGFRWGH